MGRRFISILPSAEAIACSFARLALAIAISVAKFLATAKLEFILLVKSLFILLTLVVIL